MKAKDRNREAKERRLLLPITKREKDIIFLVCKEYTSSEIAMELNRSVRTIETQRQDIIKKIGCRSSVGIAIYAIKNKIFRV